VKAEWEEDCFGKKRAEGDVGHRWEHPEPWFREGWISWYLKAGSGRLWLFFQESPYSAGLWSPSLLPCMLGLYGMLLNTQGQLEAEITPSWNVENFRC
jgi:hypothetical protein